MNIWRLLMTPFSWVLKMLTTTTGSYGLALIIFSLLAKVILYPLSLKGKRSMIKMNALNGELQALQRKYGKDQNRLSLETQKLYQKEGVSPYGGCLWSLLPMPIVIGLFTIVRSPISYLMGVSTDVVAAIQAAFEGFNAAVFEGLNVSYTEVAIAKLLGNPEYMAIAQNAAGSEASKLIEINFTFFGIDLAANPSFKFWENGITWASIGLCLLPIISAIISLLSMIVSQKTNKLNNNAPQQNNFMMYAMSPIISLWWGYSMPAGISIYWISNYVFTIVQELIMARVLRKEYAEAAARREESEAREKEEEKRRKREAAEERARRIEEEKRSKGKKKKEPKEKPVREGVPEASREGLRAYARGRAYDPNRYGGVTPYAGGMPVPVEVSGGKMIPLEQDASSVDGDGESSELE